MKASLLTCNPGTVKDTRDTCLPKAMISRLVKEWNTRHPEKHVAASENKMEQWNNLRREMVTCDTEFCAVKKLVDPKEKKEFQKFLEQK